MLKSWKTLAIYILCCFVKIELAEAQPKVNFEHFSTADGLSDNRIMCMMKDREGFMWMGSWTGINRFDGHHFVTYKSRPGDRSVLKHNRIDFITEDHAGFLWLKGYDRQVYRFDKKTEQFLSFADHTRAGNKSPASIDKIVLLNKDQVALTTKGQGVFIIAGASSDQPACLPISQNADAGHHLKSDSINFLYQDSSSKIWIGTQKGLACLEADRDGHYEKKAVIAPLENGDITSVAESTTMLWFGTGTGNLIGLNKINGKYLSLNVSNTKINHLKLSATEDHLYLTTVGDELVTVSMHDPRVLSTKVFPGHELLSIYEDHSGLIWIEPRERGIILFDPSKQTFRLFTQPGFANYLHDDEEYSVFEDNKGVVWMNMKGCGFGYFDAEAGSVKHFYNETGKINRRFSNMVSAEFMDPAGILWLSTDEGGLEKVIFQPNDFRQTRPVANTFLKADNDVRGIYSDSKDRLWIGTKGRKLYVSNDDKTIPAEQIFPNSSFSSGVYVILEDSRGNIWMGTKGDGLFKAEPLNSKRDQYKIKQFVADANNPEAISHNSVYALLEDRNGRIWIGTFGGGLNLLDETGSAVKFYHYKNQLRTYPSNGYNRVRHLATDAGGKLWIGTTDGLLLFDPASKAFLSGSFVKYGKIPGDIESLGDNDIQFLYRDSRDTMWVLTSSGGLNKAISHDVMRSMKFVNYTKKDGLPSDYLLSCTEDRQGQLWIASQNGLSRMNLANTTFRNFDAADGLPSTAFAEASCASMKNGDIIFGTVDGYIHFKPQEIVNPTINANIAFSNLQINSEDIFPGEKNSPLKFAINSSDNIIFPYNQNTLSFDYAVLDYRSQAKESYEYRLLGFDSSWRNNKSARRASYTNLPPGKYVLQVKSTSVDLYSNIPLRSLNFTILPPLWKTWWAYTVYFIVACLIIFLVMRSAFTMLRLRQRVIIERRLADLRLNFFTNVSHELRTPLTLILNPLEEISKKETLSWQGNQHINLALKNVRRMTRFINQLLDLRKAQSGKATLKVSYVELVAFTGRVAGYFSEVASRKQIGLTIEPANEQMYCWIDAEKIDIVLYNVLANAFKFTSDRKNIRIILKLSGKDNNTIIEIIDEGSGVPLDELDNIFNLYFESDHNGSSDSKGTGIGLALSKEIVQLHHGIISARNNENPGLTVGIELKAGKSHFEKDHVVFEDTSRAFEKSSGGDMDTEEETGAAIIPTNDTNGLPQLLLVEDNRDLRSFLKIQLSGLFAVETASNGEEGLKKAGLILPDLILSDVMMPVMTGIQMLDKLKKDPSTSHIPVVLLSAKFSEESQIEGLKYGADFYIGKPFNNDLLMAALNNLVNRRKKRFDSILKNKNEVDIQATPIVITSHDELFLQEVIKIVEEKMGDSQFNIDVVAESVNMSRSAFYKKLKSLTTLSPVEFVREIRLKRSIQYLDAGEHNITTIAYEAGFTSAKYFSTCFKQRFGQTPSDYIKSKVNNTAI
jgi:signal transduction histidine kinase/ligand-binding sensor domain-containing protein/DNA-binding response OmpR family regulator